MKVHELLRKVNFIFLRDYLLDLTCDVPDEQTAYFKMAYDELMQTTPDDDAETLFIRPDKDGELNAASASNLEGNIWSHALAREIILPDGLNVSDEELAAHLLWNLTFYGFSQKYRTGTAVLDKDLNIYERRCLDIRQKRMASYAHMPFKQFLRLDILDDEYDAAEDRMQRNRRHRNRAKRMRDHRQDKLLIKYKRMGMVYNTISDILAEAYDMTSEDLLYLYDTSIISDNCYWSHAKDQTKRLDYMFQIMDIYGLENYKRYDNLILIVTTDTNYPITDEELRKLNKFVKVNEPWNRCECRCVQKDGLGEGAQMLIVASDDNLCKRSMAFSSRMPGHRHMLRSVPPPAAQRASRD